MPRCRVHRNSRDSARLRPWLLARKGQDADRGNVPQPKTSCLDQILVGVRAPIAEKLPRLADFLDLIEIQVGDQNFVFIARGAGDDLAARIAEVAGAIEVPDVPGSLSAHAIDGADEVAVGDGMRGLFDLPEVLA